MMVYQHGKSRFKICLVVFFLLVCQVFVIRIFIMRNSKEMEAFIFCDFESRNIMNFGKFQDKWQVVDEKESAYVFSAYLIPEEFYTNWFAKIKWQLTNYLNPEKEDTGPKTIMLVGATSSYGLTFYCQMLYHMVNGSSRVLVTTATMLDLDTNDMKFQSCLFACPLPDKTVPDVVSLTSAKCTLPINSFLMSTPIKKQKYNFTVCLSPLFNVNDPRRFIEWVQLNRILGANYFLVYNHSVGPEMDRALRIFEKKGMVEIVPWILPMGEDIYYKAQHAALNDCLLRSRFKSKYVINNDMDEFIIPHEVTALTWNDMLKHLPHTSAYSFRSKFFLVPKNDQGNISKSAESQLEQKLITLSNFKRYKEFDERVKYIVRTETAQRIGIHNAYDLRWGRQMTVAPAFGFIHHYRTNKNKKIEKDTTVRDKYRIALSRMMKSYIDFYS